jgi:hypothetical protein
LEHIAKDKYKLEHLTVYLKSREIISDKKLLENEIRKFVNVLLNRDYNIGELKLHQSFALITFNNLSDIEEFITQYSNYCVFNVPKFICSRYKDKKQMMSENFLYDPFSMFSHFEDLSVHDPNKKPIILKNGNSNHINQSLDDLGEIIYLRAEKKYQR